MGIVCSCFSTVFLWTGELLENLALAIGEISSILIRGIFSLLIGLCDVLAAISCCCRVPYSERPGRSGYTYDTVLLADSPPFLRGAPAAVSVPAASSGTGVLRSVFTKQGRQHRKDARAAKAQNEAARKKEAAIKKEAQDAEKAAAKQKAADAKAAEVKEQAEEKSQK
ncbi:hypothetical protein CBOM_06714 [Ceraceosorus bombacis]|uniref:Uncharacterized protein n=1 Tax=Ceraceosorus bombacis TaxID=401625 RepID=A0A0N7LBH3_9BASI|nr:hypothetical protein CBOM_06714 [Ceraceosorus bombacis]